LKVLEENVISLVQSPFGNYAIQTAIESMKQGDLRGIYNSLAHNVLQLSVQKFSSNVIEKCLDYCDREIKQKFFEGIFQPEGMKSLIKSSYGFYVI
jgi:hypothetical protein